MWYSLVIYILNLALFIIKINSCVDAYIIESLKSFPIIYKKSASNTDGISFRNCLFLKLNGANPIYELL